MNIVFDNLIDVNTGKNIELDVDENVVEKYEWVLQRASAFGKRCRDVLDKPKQK